MFEDDKQEKHQQVEHQQLEQQQKQQQQDQHSREEQPGSSQGERDQQADQQEQEQQDQQPKTLKSAHVWSVVTKFLRWQEVRSSSEDSGSSSVNLEEEYAKACRTESYLEFTKRAQLLAQAQAQLKEGASTPPQLGSFELLAATLLEPDQEKVLAILVANKDVRTKPELFQLVFEYFEHSIKASNLCTLLLKTIERSRERSRDSRAILKQHSSQQDNGATLRELHRCMTEDDGKDSGGTRCFSNLLHQFQPVHDRYLNMQKKLGTLLKKTAKRFRFARRRLKACKFFTSATCVVALAVTSAALFLAPATLCLGCKAFTFPIDYVVRRASSRQKKNLDRVQKQLRQSEAVGRGTFVVVQDLDTMKGLVMRLANEVDSASRTLEFCVEHQEDGLLVKAALEQLSKNQTVFDQLLDDLEDNVYLCFMSINRSRALVVRELCLN